MIDTSKIKNHWNAMASGSVVYLDAERDTVFNLCDHIDELERKLKIAELAIYTIWCGQDSLDRKSEICREALKQIRGEE